jgi:predicted ABC-type ATPase
MLGEMHGYLDRGDSFAFETTLSGRSYAQHIPAWQAAGYHIELIFLQVRSIRLALSRVRARA